MIFDKDNKDIKARKSIALIENRTAVADLIAEADKGASATRIVYYDATTLNTPYTDGYTGGFTAGFAYINMTSVNNGCIVAMVTKYGVLIKYKSNGAWVDGWESLALNSDLANYALNSDLANYALNSDLANYMPNTGQMTRLNAVDLNTILTPGAYTASNGTTALNYPSGVNGLLLVYQASADRVRQIYFRIGTINSNDMNWYTRQISTDGATVGTWQKIGNYIEVSGTLAVGSTSITLSSDLITTSSTIDVYTDKFGVNPTAMTVSAGKVVLTFPSQSSAVNVKVRVS